MLVIGVTLEIASSMICMAVAALPDDREFAPLLASEASRPVTLPRLVDVKRGSPIRAVSFGDGPTTNLRPSPDTVKEVNVPLAAGSN